MILTKLDIFKRKKYEYLLMNKIFGLAPTNNFIYVI